MNLTTFAESFYFYFSSEPGSAAMLLTQTLAHFFWQGTAIATGFFVINAMLRDRSASNRYFAAVAALAMMAICPLFTFGYLRCASTPQAIDRNPVDSLSAPETPMLPNPIIASSESSSASLVRFSSIADESTLADQVTDPMPWMESVSCCVSSVYLLGVALFLSRLAISLRAARRLRLASAPVTDERILALVHDVAQRWAMRVVPTVAYCQQIAAPAVVGIVRPVILLPPSLMTGLSVEQLELILIHELAHIRRWDLAINLVQRLIEAFLFIHPAVWYVSHRVSVERENACDDRVLATGWSATEYVAALLCMADRSAASRSMLTCPVSVLSAAGNRPSQLKQRVLRMLGEPAKPQSKIVYSGVGGLAVAIIALATTSIVLTATPDGASEPIRSSQLTSDGVNQKIATVTNQASAENDEISKISNDSDNLGLDQRSLTSTDEPDSTSDLFAMAYALINWYGTTPLIPCSPYYQTIARPPKPGRTKKQEKEGATFGQPLKPIAGESDYLAAFDRYNEGKYSEAFKAFKKVAKKYKDTEIQEDALFMQAECAWKQDRYSQAYDCYALLLKEYPSTRHLSVVSERMFKIGRLWLGFPEAAKLSEIQQVNLDDPNQPLASDEPPNIPKNAPIVKPNFTNPKEPMFDTAGNGVAALRAVWTYDPTGPLADDAMILVACYYARCGNQVEAKQHFQNLREIYPDSPYVQNAFVLNATPMCHESPNDGTPTSDEAKLLKESILHIYEDYPDRGRIRDELAKLEDTKAEVVWKRALFYQKKRKNRVCAIFCNEIITQYPKSPYAELAKSKLLELGSEFESEDSRNVAPVSNPSVPDATIEAGLENAASFKDVVIEGNSTIPDSEISKHVKTRPGRIVTQRQIKDDVDALIRTRWFASVEPTQRITDNGSVLVFRVLERPMVRRVEYKGLKKVKQKVFDSLTQLKPGSPFDISANRECARRIEEYYHEKGFIFATVELEKGNNRDDREVVFLIHEGPKVHVTAVKFDGDKESIDGILVSKTRTKTRILWLFGGKYDPSTIQEDIEGVKQYYHSLGYFDVRIHEKLRFSDDKSKLEVHYEIDEGPRYKIRNIEIVGNKVLTVDEIRNMMHVKGDSFYNARDLGKDVETIKSKYGEQGRLYCTVDAAPSFTDEPGVLDIVFRINEDRVYRIRNINTHTVGDHPDKANPVLNISPIQPGDLADPKKIHFLKKRRLEASQPMPTHQIPGRGIEVDFLQNRNVKTPMEQPTNKKIQTTVTHPIAAPFVQSLRQAHEAPHRLHMLREIPSEKVDEETIQNKLPPALFSPKLKATPSNIATATGELPI